jgi:hypothetical protein
MLVVIHTHPEILELALNLPLFIGVQHDCRQNAEYSEKKCNWYRDKVDDMPHHGLRSGNYYNIERRAVEVFEGFISYILDTSFQRVLKNKRNARRAEEASGHRCHGQRAPGNWQPVSAPTTARPDAEKIRIVVKRKP